MLSHRSVRRGARPGFSLIELVIVIGIIALLMGILLPVVARARELAKQGGCKANLATLGRAWVEYHLANGTNIVGGNTGPGSWVDSGTDEGAIKRGLLFRFVKDVEVYRCPKEPGKSNLRSYSVSAYLNGEGSPKAKTIHEIKRPSTAVVFIEEYDPRGYNINSFWEPVTGDSFIDMPAAWHDDGCNLAFADGHAEYWHWEDVRTRNLSSFGANTPNNPDLKRLQAAMKYWQ
ncbi:MAG TPA: prepilin-type N-terminal cleavage/methylation domain-containing protein [Humisphaera sp.]